MVSFRRSSAQPDAVSWCSFPSPSMPQDTVRQEVQVPGVPEPEPALGFGDGHGLRIDLFDDAAGTRVAPPRELSAELVDGALVLDDRRFQDDECLQVTAACHTLAQHLQQRGFTGQAVDRTAGNRTPVRSCRVVIPRDSNSDCRATCPSRAMAAATESWGFP
jgi:hypothetical protein